MRSKSAFAALCALVLAACSSGSPKATTTTTSPDIGAVSLGGAVPTPTDVPQTIDPCTLMTASEASLLVGRVVRRSAGGGVGSLYCKYAAGKAAGAEVTVKVDASPGAARAGYISWVQPIPGVANGLTLSQIHNLGDQASETHTANVNDGIYVRKGKVLVKIGAYPPVADAALRAAVTRALSRV